MKTVFRLANILGIKIEVHLTFLVLLAFFALFFGPRGLMLIAGIFFFVTLHELAHSVAAAYFGIKVKKITLLPIGGVASMPETPKNPFQELVISLAGPASNILILAVLYYPLRAMLGADSLMLPLKIISGKAAYSGEINIMAHVYWINLVLAVFNMIPAFPMDGGRVLRAILSYRMGYKKATEAAVKVGHVFALFFAFYGIVKGNILLLVIAVFIYTAATAEGFQASVVETIKKYYVKDVLPETFLSVEKDTPVSRVLEMIFHSHQEDFPVVEKGALVGLITRREVISGVHEKGKECRVADIMRTDVPAIGHNARLDVAQKVMYKYNTKAVPVEKTGEIVGVVTLEDINRVYIIAEEI